MKVQHWAVSFRYAASGGRPGNRRHPAPEDFHRRTVVGPAAASTVEAVFNALGAPEEVRAKVRASGVMRNFVEGRLDPDPAYPHHTGGRHYVSDAPDAQLVEWSVDFAFVTRVIVDQQSGGLT